MIRVSNNAPVLLTPGQALTFNELLWKTGKCEFFRNPGAAVRVGEGAYTIQFHGNISSAVGGTSAQLTIYADGVPLPETLMISTPAVADIFNNVSAATTIGNCGNCCNPNPGSITITVVNTGTGNLTVATGANLSVERRA